MKKFCQNCSITSTSFGCCLSSLNSRVNPGQVDLGSNLTINPREKLWRPGSILEIINCISVNWIQRSLHTCTHTCTPSHKTKQKQSYCFLVRYKWTAV